MTSTLVFDASVRQNTKVPPVNKVGGFQFPLFYNGFFVTGKPHFKEEV